MANTKQAKKRATQNVKRRQRNRSVATQVRHAVRDLRKTATEKAEAAQGMLASVVSELDRAVRKGVLHQNTAARLKSRVTRSVGAATKA